MVHVHVAAVLGMYSALVVHVHILEVLKFLG